MVNKFMVNITNGDLVHNVTSGIIVHQVNAQGFMGSGIALTLKNKYPKIFEDYTSVIKQNTPDKGKSYMGMVIPSHVTPELFVMNLVGQQFFGKFIPGGASADFVFTDYDALEKGLAWVSVLADVLDIQEIHLPLIGCGLARGKWEIVLPIIERQLKSQNVNIWKL